MPNSPATKLSARSADLIRQSAGVVQNAEAILQESRVLREQSWQLMADSRRNNKRKASRFLAASA